MGRGVRVLRDTDSDNPPRGANLPSTFIRRGWQAPTRSSRMSLMTCSLKA